jgi:catechol 2,3-dioxygenase-like lactoylglutathione lyase family enzyme
MAIIGIKGLRYGVEDVAIAAQFFTDFGLSLTKRDADRAVFLLADGSTVELLPLDHPSLPQGSLQGAGVREILWGIDTPTALARVVEQLSCDHTVTADDEGAHRFVPAFGIPMALAHWERRRVENAPDPLNAPDRINRLNTHRKWRKRAHPKVISHAVFRIADYGRATAFMHERLGFRISDVQQEFGIYLRADGSNNHHNCLLLNANAPLFRCDGRTAFDHVNFGVEDIDELMIGANYMARRGWGTSVVGLGRHRIDSALFYYLPCPAGGEVEYGADADYIDDSWVPRHFPIPLFGYAHFTHNIPDFMKEDPKWEFAYLKEETLTELLRGRASAKPSLM